MAHGLDGFDGFILIFINESFIRENLSYPSNPCAIAN